MLNNKDAYGVIDADKSSNAVYIDIVNKFKKLKVYVIASDLDNTSVNFGMSQFTKSFKDDRYLFVFEGAAEQKVIDMPMPFIRENNKKPSFGDAFMSDGSDVFRVKTIVNDNSTER